MNIVKSRRPHIRPSWPQVALLALIGPALLALMALFLGGEIRSARDARTAVGTSVEYNLAVAELLSLLKDAETGQRGYLISGDRAFLAPYLEARSHLMGQFTEVARLTPPTSADAADLRRLDRLIRAKFVEMQALIDLHDRAGPGAASARLGEGLGKKLMDDIRDTVAKIEQRSRANLENIQKTQTERGDRTGSIIWSYVAITALAAAILSFLIGRGMRLRNQLSLEREESATRQRAIFEGTTDAIILINPSGSIETINPAAEQMFGFRPDDLLRRDISTLIDIAPGEGPFLERIGIDKGSLRKTELLDIAGRDSQGETVSVDITLGTMRLPDGLHIIAALRDAGSRKEVDRLKDDFISTVSHELRTPLTSVVGSLGLLRSGAAGPLPAQAQRLAEIAETNSQRLIRLINDILDIDQIRKGRMAFDYAVVDLRDVMTRTIQTMQGLADRRDIRIGLTAPDGPVMACADTERLVQVAGNLLSNAIKFSPEGSTVAFELIEGRDDHIIQITDRGPGIDPEFARHIFNRFAQGARPDKQLIAGTGLGLAISREIVRNHGGEISFENRAEGGARFAFSVPRDSAHVAEGDRSTRLLICEDDSDAGFTIQSILTAHGYASDLVTTVRDGIAHARSQPYSGVLLDLTLADSDGTDLLRALKADKGTQRLPVIIISGTPPHNDIDGDAYAGWLQKPFDPPRLIQLIQRAIRRAGARKAVILHVDDDDDTRELFSAALAGRGLLLNAGSLAAARTILAARRPDIIVLDLGLPDGSGQDLLVELKKQENPLPVILYSAQEVDKVAGALADAVIIKSRRALPKLASTVLDIVDRHGGPQ
ncbi:CHASE3 domain-containing protein [Sphingomonas sp. SRS2]|uniref:CHASE3 domain-containing protein n=1 Tax=Sphingomonas sp. SRS2 TaxID=133190 RepID=UPI0006184A7C|nr:CHASE3 domain-containing protein [Sphingomonas sp. SRS2]KKC27119.1 histidine kinase [Sphingomonas sp. SRS2]